MKLINLMSGLSICISNEEKKLVNKIRKENTDRTKLTEREQHLADLLVSRGILERSSDGDTITYSYDDPIKLRKDING